MSTGRVASAIEGDKPYQLKARAALPLLVRQARAQAKIYYSELADELGMPNPRNLNYPLGSIGTTLEDLSEKWDEHIPPLQCVVVNKSQNLPGEGFAWFVRDQADWLDLSLRERRIFADGVLNEIFMFTRWHEVLEELGLEPAEDDLESVVADAVAARGAGGEGPEHEALKRFVAENPQLVGLPASAAPGRLEYPLPSGDCVDVYFETGERRLGVEVKSAISDSGDIGRGLFQCVKYRAVLRASVVVEDAEHDADAVLVLGSALNEDQRRAKRRLGLRVIENVTPQ